MKTYVLFFFYKKNYCARILIKTLALWLDIGTGQTIDAGGLGPPITSCHRSDDHDVGVADAHLAIGDARVARRKGRAMPSWQAPPGRSRSADLSNQACELGKSAITGR